MKRCPRCGQTYTESDINFCLNDGELLSRLVDEQSRGPFSDEPLPTRFAEDSPPTLVMNTPRVTNQANWQSAPPLAQRQNTSPIYQPPQYAVGGYSQSRDQTLPTVAIALGIGALVFVCCYGGIWLGIPAAIVGFIGLRNSDNHPNRYAGRGLAIGGMVLGIVSFLLTIVFIIFAVLA